MAKHIFKNISDVEQNVIGVGVVKAGQTIEVDEPFENPNFEEVSKSSQKREEEMKQGVEPHTEPAKRK